MQDKFIEAFAAKITDVGLDPVQRSKWANTGSIHAQSGFVSKVVIEYSFQDDYATITLSGSAVSELIGAKSFVDNPPHYRVEDDERNPRIIWFMLKYGSDRVPEMFDTVGRILAYARIKG